MLRCGILNGMQVLSFNRIGTYGLLGGIHELEQQHPIWVVFEQDMKSTYAIDDSPTERGNSRQGVEGPRGVLRIRELLREVFYTQPSDPCVRQGCHVPTCSGRPGLT